MAKRGKISIFDLGKTVLDYIKEQDKLHTHKLSSIEGANDIVTLTEMNRRLDDKSNIGHTHRISSINGLQTELNEKSPLNHTHNINDLDGTLGNVIKGFIYNNADSVSINTNCAIESINDAEVVNRIIKTNSTGDFNFVFDIPKDKICLGLSSIRIRFKSSGSIEGQTPKIIISSVSSFNKNDSSRILGEVLNSNITLANSNEGFVTIFNTFDMKLFNTSSIGIEIKVEHQGKTGEYQLYVDDIIISPAFPGVFVN